MGDREKRVAEWIRTRIGEANLHSRERAMRILEEAVELAQAEGITAEQVQRQTAHVFDRPAGNPVQEASGIAVCLLGWCASAGTTFDAIADAEITRIEAKPIDQIRGSLARKADADLVCTVGEQETAWLAERFDGADGPEYVTVSDIGMVEFTKDHNKAIRFKRMEDARQMAGLFEFEDVRAREHSWSDKGS
jgi:hypothetical protein